MGLINRSILGDATFSPRPSSWSKADPRTWINFRRRPAIHFTGCYVEIKQFWHLSWDIPGGPHGHIGFAPISLKDPRWIWSTLPLVVNMVDLFRGQFPDSEVLFVQWETRTLGWGKWD